MVSSGDAVKGAAFLNPDGTMVYMAVYYGDKKKKVQIQADKKIFNYTFKSGEVVTFKWKK